MEKKITIYTVKNEDATVSKSFTTKKLAESAQETLTHFGLVTELGKETKVINLD